MKPIYFPFTSISEKIVNSISGCFKPIRVYQPYPQEPSAMMRQWEAQDRVKRCLPIRTDTAKLMKIVTDYKAWMKLHEHSGGIEYFKTFGQRIPFFDEFSSAHIKAAIAQRVKSEKTPVDTQSDASAQLLEAIVFLCMAHEFDQYQLEIAKDLSVFNTRQQEMFESLKGEFEGIDSDMDAKPVSDEAIADDLGQYHPLARIRAWLQLWLRDQTDDCFFITDSPAILECLTANASNLQKTCSLQLPLSRNDASLEVPGCEELIKKIKSLAGTTWLASTESSKQNDLTGAKGPVLTCYISPNESPDLFFRPFLADKLIMPPKTGSRIKNTLIGLVKN